MKKILIANRGEIARRIIRTCQKLNIETVAVYSKADKDLPYVKEATVAYEIGDAPVSKSYLNMDKILEIAKKEQVDGIHPGYGLLSENSEFAKKVKESQIIFIGPNHETIALMGDKIAARRTMMKANVPVVPGAEIESNDVREAMKISNEIGYPVMLKASSGGGGVGMALVHNDEELETAFTSVKSKAKAYFGNDSLFIEKYIKNARHIEVQIFGDHHGNCIHLFERDCSVQRRNQKVIEEAQSPFLGEKTREKMYEAAIKAANAVSYVNAGTVEFILDEHNHFYFLEMNTRLQVEHPVTECITGLDLVEWQINIANGLPLPITNSELTANGHSMEFRIYAEDPSNFYPSPGIIQQLKWGNVDGIRIDSGYDEGNTVTPFYDPLIAKIIVHGENRKECLQKGEKFFKETEIRGIKTNIPLFIQLFQNDSFIQGNYNTNLLKIIKK